MILDDIRSLSSLINPKPTKDKIQQIQLIDISSDPNQPRKTFDDESLAELADSIQQYGVLQPIGVKEVDDGLYMIVFGERRYRASVLAVGVHSIPAFIIESASSTVQMIENIQRHDLMPHEISQWIQERLDKGETSVSIAKRLGKSKDYVSLYKSFASMPDYLQSVYDRGLCTSVKSLVTLQRHAKEHEAQVKAFCDQMEQPISQQAVNAFVTRDATPNHSENQDIVETRDSQSVPKLSQKADVKKTQKGVLVRVEGTDLMGLLDLKTGAQDNSVRVLIDDTAQYFDKESLRIHEIIA